MLEIFNPETLTKEIQKGVSAEIRNVFERYLNDPADKEKVEKTIQKDTQERDSFWEELWQNTLKEGKSYIERFVPELDTIMDFAEAGKDLLTYDLTGFIKSFLSKDNLREMLLPDSVAHKIVEACIACPLFLDSIKQHDAPLAEAIQKNKNITDLVKGFELLVSKGITEYSIADMIKSKVAEYFPLLHTNTNESK